MELVELSASQLKLAKLCMARWGAKYLEGLDDPAGPAAEEGKEVHKQLEDWALHGKMPTHPKALKGLPHATAPGTASIERPIYFVTPQSRYKGFVDVQYAEGSVGCTPILGFAAHVHDHVVVQDWKTTSNMSYALTVDTLPDDIQFNIYLYEAFKVLRAKTAAGKWVYLPPSGPAKPVVVKADRNRVLDFVLGPVDTAAKELQQLYQIRPKWQELPKNTTGCFAFNKRCPHYDLCKPTQQSFSMAEAKDMPTVTDFRNSIAADFPGAASAPAIPPSLPATPPPAPAAAPKAPELTQEQIDALVQNELRKRQQERDGAPTNAPGQVDRSFVNPPEANPTPAANPQQAADQQGVKPPAPIAPVEDALTGWNRDQLKAYGAVLGIAEMAKSRAREPSLRDTLRAKCAELGLVPGAAPGSAPVAPAAPSDVRSLPTAADLAGAAERSATKAVNEQGPTSTKVAGVEVAPPALPAALAALTEPFAPSAPPVPTVTVEIKGLLNGKPHTDVVEMPAAAVKSKFNGFGLIDGNVLYPTNPKLCNALHLADILTAAHNKLGVRDYGLIQYEGAARLCGAVEDLFHLGELQADVVVFNSTTREGAVLANTLMALAAHRA